MKKLVFIFSLFACLDVTLIAQTNTAPTVTAITLETPSAGLPHKALPIPETQFDALVAALPAVIVGQNAANTALIEVQGNAYQISANGSLASKKLSSAQLTTFLAALPTAPSGYSYATNCQVVMANRDPRSGKIFLFVQWTQ